MNAVVSRRSVLVAGVTTGALLVAGKSVVFKSQPATGAKVLSSAEISVVEQAAKVLFPEGVFPVSGGDGVTGRQVDELLAEVIDPPAVAPFRSMLAALEWGTLVSRGTRFSDLPEDEARDVLHTWASENPAPRRLAFDSLQAVLSMAFLRRPEVLRVIGWRVGCGG